jgi:hypothetical protein
MRTQAPRRLAIRATVLGVAVVLAATASAVDLSSLTAAERSQGLKTALDQAARLAIDRLGRPDGYLADPEVRIPLPGRLGKAQKTLKALGLGPQVDDLVTTMNRAAEAAVPEARAVFADSIRRMTVQDAVGILTGPNDAATQYFRRTMSDSLTQRFLPIVAKATQRVELAQSYDRVAGRAARLGLIGREDASLDAYVTQKALDGLFLKMAREEAAIRANPLGQSSAILKKVFGALK